MKRSITVLFVFVLMIGSDVVAQDRLTYRETNVGLSWIHNLDNLGPGYSYLLGQQIFVSEKSFWDVQGGFAIPTFLTMKVGRGFKSPKTGRTFSGGARIWPAHLYAQLGFPTARCCQEVPKRVKKWLKRNGSDQTHLLRGEWNVSIEYGMGQFQKERFLNFWYLSDLSFSSVAIVSLGLRWYLERKMNGYNPG